MRRFLAVLHARNMEFLRDRSSLGWNVLVPVLLVFGLATIFADTDKPLFKVAVLGEAMPAPDAHPFLATPHVQFFSLADREAAVAKVGRHQVDMLVEVGEPGRYWVNPGSPKGLLLERLLGGAGGRALLREPVEGYRIRYIDWLLPGVLAMNIMFSCLFGVGFVVVRYRKSGFLKRLNATPLRAIEFIGAQIASRLILILLVSALVYAGTAYFIGFRSQGGHLTLFVVTLMGAISMIALSFVVAARVDSEELASGLLNVISWPMMLLSGVWFSLDGSNPLLQQGARLLPLTHLLEGARAVMLDGAGLAEVSGNLLALAAMSVVFLATGAFIFKWRPD